MRCIMFHDIKHELLSKDIVIDNTYLNKYVELLETRRYQERVVYKTQKHHIIPKFVFEYIDQPCDDSEDNLVNLYYSEHVLAHFYLAMCAKDSRVKTGNLCAVREVIYGKDAKSTERLLLDSMPEIQLFYEESKHINCLKADTPSKISASLTGGKYVQNPETLEYRCCKGELLEKLLSDGWIFRHPPQSDTARQKLSSSRKGKRTIYKDSIIKQVHETELDGYLSDGWKLGNPRQKGRSNSLVGKIAVTKGEQTKYIAAEDLNIYLQQGFTRGNNRKGKPSSNKGVKFTQSHKDNIARTRIGRVAIHKDHQITYVYPDDVSKFQNEGWLIGTGAYSPGTSGKMWVTNDVVERYVRKEEVDIYVNSGDWRRGRLSRKKLK